MFLCNYSLSERSINTTLRSDCVTSRGEKLGYACSVETSLCQTESGSQTGTTSTNNDGIVLVINDWVLVGEVGRCLLCAERRVGVDLGGGSRAGEKARLLSLDCSREL